MEGVEEEEKADEEEKEEEEDKEEERGRSESPDSCWKRVKRPVPGSKRLRPASVPIQRRPSRSSNRAKMRELERE